MRGTRSRWPLVVAGLAIGACNGTPDLCTHSVEVLHKIENEAAVCFPDAGLPPDTEASSEIARCKEDLTGCTAQDQSLLSASADCFDQLPPLECQWFDFSDAGPSPGLLLYALEALECEPTKPLSSTCEITSIPLDAGFGL
jgi:hypothetical protein